MELHILDLSGQSADANDIYRLMGIISIEFFASMSNIHVESWDKSNGLGDSSEISSFNSTYK